MKKVLAVLAIALLTMYFIPQVWYFLLAMVLLLFVLMLVGVLFLFMAKALGIAGLEVWLAQRFLRKKRRS